MITLTKAGLIAAVTAPLFMLHAQPAFARPAAPTAAAALAPVVLPHISIVEQGGGGSPVVLIPGLSSPRAVWDGVAPDLARTHRVLLVQVNGFGGDAPGANLRPGILAGVVADLHGYLAQQKIAGAAVIGHSMGGLVSLMLAKAHPGDVGRLMIVDSLPWYGMLFGPTATMAMVEPQAKAMRDRSVASYGTPMPEAAAAGIAAQLALKPESRALVTRWAQAADPRVTGQALYEDLSTDVRADIARIATPITLVYPNAGGMAGALYHAAYADAPHVSYVEVPDSAHFVMLDQPAPFNAAVTAFLK